MEPHGQSLCLHAEVPASGKQALRHAGVVPKRRPQGANIPYQRTNSPMGKTPACRQAPNLAWYGAGRRGPLGSG
jgi:hypothetical protein